MSTHRGRALRAIVATDLKRTLRDKTGLFFMIVLPVIVIVIVGATFSANSANLPMGLVDDDHSAESEALIAQLSNAGTVTIRTFDDEDEMRTDVRTGLVAGGIVISAGFGSKLDGDATATVTLLTENPQDGQALAQVIQAAADELGTSFAARRFAIERTGASESHADAAVNELRDSISHVEVTATSVGTAPLEGTDNQYSFTAPSNLVLFVFVNSLTVGGALIETRRLGVARRMLAAPVTVSTVLLGSGLARFAFALLQSALILVIGQVFFDVGWGQTIAVAMVVVAFSLVGSGAGLLVGAAARNTQQAQALGIPVAIGLAMLGGCMWPLDVVSPALRTVGHLTPHAWAMDAWVKLIFEGGGLDAIWVELAVLGCYALGLIVVATLLLRHRLLRGS